VCHLAYKRIAVAIFIPVALIANFVVLSDVMLTAISHISGVHNEFRRIIKEPVAGSSAGIHRAKPLAQRRRVTEATSSWLTEKGRQLAERQDNRFSLGISANTEPTYQETIITPTGPVEIFSSWSVGRNRPVSAPPGFVKLAEDDPLYQYRHPLAKLLQPVAIIGAVGIVPALFAYLIFMIWRPKEQYEEVT
jgi:hypothetical protein